MKTSNQTRLVIFCIVMIIMALGIMAACDVVNDEEIHSTDPGLETCDEVNEEGMQWAEPKLEALVREKIGKHEGAITQDDISHIWGVELIGDSHIYFNADGGYNMYLSDSDEHYENFEAIINPSGVDVYRPEGIMNMYIEPYKKDGSYSVNSEEYSRGSISSLADFAKFTNLKYLHVYKNSLSDLSGLSSLKGLVELKLIESDIVDIAALSELKQIDSLHLTANRIIDISPLGELGGLRRLYLWVNDIRQIDSIASLTGLSILNLSCNPISNMDALSNLNSITRLYIFNTSVSDLSFLFGKSSLVSLAMYDLDVDSIDLSPMATAGFNGVVTIHMSQNRAEILNFRSLAEINCRIYVSVSPSVNITEEDIAWLRENFPDGIPSIVD